MIQAKPITTFAREDEFEEVVEVVKDATTILLPPCVPTQPMPDCGRHPVTEPAATEPVKTQTIP